MKRNIKQIIWAIILTGCFMAVLWFGFKNLDNHLQDIGYAEALK